ncbi:MAG: DUF2442 domain-containing protein [Lachnospiraceae bacterium]|nr:DUF2442 domain-containing protein [Lachnospiraceae bacterium]
MLRPTAKTVIPLPDYLLQIEFDNGEMKIFDVKPYIRGEWYSELANEEYFQSVSANGYTVEWANGQDVCPDELYYNSVNFST